MVGKYSNDDINWVNNGNTKWEWWTAGFCGFLSILLIFNKLNFIEAFTEYKIELLSLPTDYKWHILVGSIVIFLIYWVYDALFVNFSNIKKFALILSLVLCLVSYVETHRYVVDIVSQIKQQKALLAVAKTSLVNFAEGKWVNLYSHRNIELDQYSEYAEEIVKFFYDVQDGIIYLITNLNSTYDKFTRTKLNFKSTYEVVEIRKDLINLKSRLDEYSNTLYDRYRDYKKDVVNISSHERVSPEFLKGYFEKEQEQVNRMFKYLEHEKETLLKSIKMIEYLDGNKEYIYFSGEKMNFSAGSVLKGYNALVDEFLIKLKERDDFIIRLQK